MFDFRFINEKITGIGGQSVMATKVGKKKVLFVQGNRKVTERIISPVKYCPNIKERLISITSEMTNEGAKLSSNDCDNISLSYVNGDEIIFDCRTKTKAKWIPSVDVVSTADEIKNGI